jgi:hypothetical protein
MEQANSSVRDRLLSRLPQPENLPAYREEVSAALAKNEKTFRRQKWATGALWIYVIGFAVIPLTMGWLRLDTRNGATYGFVAFFMLLFGAVELLKLSINRNRVEILKELKQVQLQVLELQASLVKGTGAPQKIL